METGEQGAQVPLLRTLAGQGPEDRVVVGETGLRKKSCAREAGEKNPEGRRVPVARKFWLQTPAAAGEDGQFPTPTHTPRPDWSISTLFEKPYGVSRPLPGPGANPCGGGEGVSYAAQELGFKPEQSYKWGNGGPERSNNLPQVTQLLSGRTRTIYPNGAHPTPPYSKIRPCGLCGWCFPLAFVLGCPNGQEDVTQGVASKELTDTPPPRGRSTHDPNYEKGDQLSC